MNSVDINAEMWLDLSTVVELELTGAIAEHDTDSE